MALFGTNWHCLGGEPSPNLNLEKELGKPGNKAGTLFEKQGKTDTNL